jgi:hypothetical protein
MTSAEGIAARPGVSMPGDVELRPAMRRKYSKNTLRCYLQRLGHYETWCAAEGLQTGVDHITGEKILAYVLAQIERWQPHRPDGDQPAGEQTRLRPDTLRQAINGLRYYGERAGVAIDDREAHEATRLFADWWADQGHEPTYRVAGRRSPRRARRGG